MKHNGRPKRKWKKRLIIIFSILVVIVLAISIYISKEWNNFVQDYLSKNQPIPHHTIQIEDSHFNLLTSSFSFEGVAIQQKDQVVTSDKSSEKDIPFKIKSEIKSIKISLSTIFKLLNKNPLKGAKVSIIEPNLQLDFKRGQTEKPSSDESIKKVDIVLEQLEIIKGMVNIKMPEGHVFNGEIDDFEAKYIVFSEVLEWHKHFEPKNIRFKFNKLFLKLHETPYDMEVGGVSYNGDDGLEVKHLNIIPSKPLRYLYKEAGYQKVFYQVKLNQFLIPQIIPKIVNKKRLLHIPNISLVQLNLTASKDKNYPIDTSIYKPLPMDLISAIGIPLRIDNISSIEGKVTYQEIPHKGNKYSKVIFNDTHTEVKHVYSPTYPHNKDQDLHINFHGKLFHHGEVKVDLKSPYDEAYFSVTGEMGKFPLTELNDLVSNSAHFKFLSGTNNKLSFKATANHEQMNGNLHFAYNDLEIEVLSHDNKKRSKLKSALAHLFVRHDNPLKGDHSRSVKFTFNREPHKSFINYIWKGALSGIRKSVGVPGQRNDRK